MSIYQKGRIPKRNVEKQSNRFLYISNAEAYRTKVLVEKVSIETSNLLLLDTQYQTSYDYLTKLSSAQKHKAGML